MPRRHRQALSAATIWMVEDLEPFPDSPAVGEVCEPSTHWATPEMSGVPAEMVCEVEASVAEVMTFGGVERVAHLGHGFTTMVPEHMDVIGETTLTGCLVWDRYLWLDYRTIPVGRALVGERASLVRRAVHTSTRHSGWFTVRHVGPTTLHRGRRAPEGGDIVSYALSVTLV